MRLELNIAVCPIRLADLLIEGLEQGIHYWGTADAPMWRERTTGETRFDGRAKTDCYYDPESRAVITDRESGVPEGLDRHTLDHKAVMRGLKIMAESYPRHFANWLAGQDDAETGDVFVQCAVFGKVVYG